MEKKLKEQIINLGGGVRAHIMPEVSEIGFSNYGQLTTVITFDQFNKLAAAINQKIEREGE